MKGLIIFGLFVFSVYIILLYKQKLDWQKVVSGLLLIVMAGFCLYRLGNFPNIFIDEANYYYDAQSLVKYGVDSHLMKYPIYFQSFLGQGQSSLYAYMSFPILKCLGISIYNFRLTQVIVAMISMLFMCYLLNKYYSKLLLPITTAFSTAPYLLTEVRYAMDCNIAIWIMLLGICLLFLGLNTKNYKRVFSLLLFYLLLGLSAYSYNVSWLYLPLIVIGVSYLLVANKVVSIRNLVIYLVGMAIELIPIIIFAIRSNISSLNKTFLFGPFTIPKLPVSRANSSFIDFHGNILKNILNNIYNGTVSLFWGSDDLPWNSFPNFGAYYLFAILLFLIGLKVIYSMRRKIEIQIMVVYLLSNLLIWMIVQPNYNHWMFSHIPNLFVIGLGIYSLPNVSFKTTVFTYMLTIVVFANTYYKLPRYTGFEISSIQSVKYMEERTDDSKVYFDTPDKNFLLIVRDFSNKSPYLFQKTKDHPYSTKYLMAYEKYDRYKKLSEKEKLTSGNYLVTNQMNFSKEYKRVGKPFFLGNIQYGRL